MGTQRRQRRGAWLGTLAAVASVTVLLVTLFTASAHSRAGASTGVAPPFSVYKNTIVDANGNPFFMRGAGSPTLTWSCDGLQTNQAPGPIPATDFSTMANVWKANTVTIYVNQDFWLYPSLRDSYGNSCATYRSVVEQAVTDAEDAGLQVILGPPVNDGGDAVPPTQWCAYQAAGSDCMGQWCMPDVNTDTLWQSLAQTFGTDPSVFFELYAEPHNVSWSVWRNGGSISCRMHAASGTTAVYTYTAVGMQQLTDTIRATGAENIVLAGGISWAYNLSGVPAHYLTGTNVAYSTHIYTGNTATWATDVDNLASSAPVVATELGDKSAPTLKSCTSTTFVGDLLANLSAHGIGYTAYAWIQPGWWTPPLSVGCGDQALIQNAAGLCISDGCAVQSNSIGLWDGTVADQVPTWVPISGTDPVLPTTSVSAPAGGSVVSGTSTLLTAGASDSGSAITKVEFRLSDGPPGQTVNEQLIATGTPGAGSYTGSWDTTAVPNGVYVLQSVAYDAAGGVTFSTGVSVTVGN